MTDGKRLLGAGTGKWYTSLMPSMFAMVGMMPLSPIDQG